MLLRLGAFPLKLGSRTLEPFFSECHENQVQFLCYDWRRIPDAYSPIVDEIGEYLLGLDGWRWPDRRKSPEEQSPD
jgi:hypothetical protein